MHLSSGSVFVTVNVVLLMLTATAHSWSLWSAPGSDKGWSLRSAYCAETNAKCNKAVQCCNSKDICEGTFPNSGICKSYARPYKRKLDTCTTSADCAEGCCRVYRAHRVGRVLRCGTQSTEYMTFKCT